jgi:hypothetical protein
VHVVYRRPSCVAVIVMFHSIDDAIPTELFVRPSHHAEQRHRAHSDQRDVSRSGRGCHASVVQSVASFVVMVEGGMNPELVGKADWARAKSNDCRRIIPVDE